MTETEEGARRLAELKKSISEMTDGELRSLIGTTRNNRVPPAKQPKAASAKKKAPKLSDKDLMLRELAKLSPEDQAAFFAKHTKDD